MKIYLRGMESKLVPYSSENLKGLDWIAYREFIEGIRLLKGLNLYDKQERWGDRIIKKAEGGMEYLSLLTSIKEFL